MELAIMIEGQSGLTWPRWQAIARAVEELGFAGLYRSDHFTDPEGPHRDSLELWASLTWLASHTQRIQFGPLVSPLSFRHPVWTARTALAVDDLSGGRLVLGLGAGWQEREHAGYGFDLGDIPRRLARFGEGVEVVARLLHGDEPFSFDGEFFQLHDALLLPRPGRPGGPPILIGGGRAVLPLAARYADEWNTAFVPPDRFARLNARLDELIQSNGRRPGDVRRSLMTGVVWGRDEREVADKADKWHQTSEELRAGGVLVGTSGAIVEALGRLAEAGAQRVMVQWQWYELDDLDALAAFARSVLPQL